MKYLSFLILLALIGCGNQEIDTRHDVKDPAKAKVSQPKKSQPTEIASTKNLLNLSVKNKDAAYNNIEDEIVRVTSFGARITDANTEEQTVTIQYGYKARGVIPAKLTDLVLKANEENTLTMSSFSGSNEEYRVKLTAEGHYCYMFFAPVAGGKSFYVRDYDCNLVVAE